MKRYDIDEYDGGMGAGFTPSNLSIPSGVNCDKCGKFIGQRGEVYYEHGDGYYSQGIYITGGKCEKCLAKVGEVKR